MFILKGGASFDWFEELTNSLNSKYFISQSLVTFVSRSDVLRILARGNSFFQIAYEIFPKTKGCLIMIGFWCHTLQVAGK